MSSIPYASAIGSIIYAMISTQPDVAYTLSMCSSFQANLGEAHWTTSKSILKYKLSWLLKVILMKVSKLTEMITAPSQGTSFV